MLGASSEFPQCLIDSFHTTMLYSAACLLRCACIMSVDEQLHPAERVRSGGWGGGRGKGEGGWGGVGGGCGWGEREGGGGERERRESERDLLAQQSHHMGA